MKDFRFLMGIARTAEEIPSVMQSLLTPFEGCILAFHHDVTPRGQHFLVTYTVQLDVHHSEANIHPEGRGEVARRKPGRASKGAKENR